MKTRVRVASFVLIVFLSITLWTFFKADRALADPLNKVEFAIEHGYWFDTQNDSVQNVPMLCWHEWVFQVGNLEDESRQPVLNPNITVTTNREFVSFFPGEPEISNGNYSWNFHLELPENTWLPVTTREAGFLDYRRPGLSAVRHVSPETLSEPITTQTLTLTLTLEEPLSEDLNGIEVNLGPPNVIFEQKSLVNCSVVSLAPVEDWQVRPQGWYADPHNVKIGNAYVFTAILEATKSPELLGSPVYKPSIGIHYTKGIPYGQTVVGSSVTVEHPEGPVVTFSAEGTYEWGGSMAYNSQGFGFNPVISEITLNPNPPPSYIVRVPATIDLHPDTLNLKSQGKWITAYTELPDGYNAAEIDVSTVMLNGTVPAERKPTAIGDYDGDGVPDLMVKFNRTAVSELILSQGTKYGNVTLTVAGRLYDGTMFEGSGVIRVRMPEDVNCDGKVDAKDVLIVLKAFWTLPNCPRWNPLADLNEDGMVDARDLCIVCVNYGKTYT
jgi:hypothetical protein